MKVLILAAGYGTRLYALIKDTPKPLLKVADKSLIDHALKKIESLNDLNEVIVVTNNKFYGHFLDWAAEKESYSVPISIVNDGSTSPEDRLGSVGDIHFVIQEKGIKDDLLVMGGDNLFDFNLDQYLGFAQTKRPHSSIGLFDIECLQEAHKFGVVETQEDGKVVSFEEKPEFPKSSLIAMCFYFFPKESLGLVADYIGESNKTDKAGDYIHWLSVKKQVFGFKFEGKWFDIGSVESYHEAQEKFMS